METSSDLLKGKTFSIDLSSDGAARLREAVKQKLEDFMGYTDDVLAVGLWFHPLLFSFYVYVFMLVHCGVLGLGLKKLVTYRYGHSVELSWNSIGWALFLVGFDAL